MSIKGDIFKIIGDHLMAKLQFADGSLPNLQWYDKDFGQADLLRDGVIVLPLPAVLISFKTPEWSSGLSSVQQGRTAVRVRVLFENYADSFQASTGESINQDKAIQFFEFNEKVHLALSKLQGDNFTGLERSGDDEDEDHTNVITTDVFYSTIITDDSANATVELESPVPAKTRQHDIERPDIETDHQWVV